MDAGNTGGEIQRSVFSPNDRLLVRGGLLKETPALKVIELYSSLLSEISAQVTHSQCRLLK